MTRLTHQQHQSHHHHHHRRDYITPQHEEELDLSSRHKFSVVHRHSPSPHTSELAPSSSLPPAGYASLPTSTRDLSEPCTDKAEEIHLIDPSLLDDLDDPTFDFDRMSDHDPSSGDGDEGPPSPESAAYPAKTQWQSPSSPSTRPPNPPGRTQNTSSMTGRISTSTAAVSAQSNDGRQVHGQAQTSLPAEKVFPIQVGSEIFRLSGASISSDGPSYFTQFFEDQVRQNEETGGVRTLYIDRDPETFRDIARHLQGYYVKPRNGTHFVRLFADAQFYSLPRLISQLFESEIFIQIGEEHFQIPKDIFSDPGNSPNFFSLGFAVFFSTPREVFPGLDRRGLLRPPPINPPYVPSRSAKNFAQLLHLLRGYPLHIRDEVHRAELLKDCRYFHLRGLEQRLIAHEISYNLEREKHEICLRIDDLRPSGISYHPDEPPAESAPSETGWVQYARPFVDEQSYELVVEIGGESTVLDLDEMRVDFHGKTKARVSSLFQVVANKMGLPSNQPLGLIMLSGGNAKRSPSPGHSPLSEDKVRVRFEKATDVVIDNTPLDLDWESEQGRHMRTGAVKRMTNVVDGDDTEDSNSTTSEPRAPVVQSSTSSTSSSSSAAAAAAAQRQAAQRNSAAMDRTQRNAPPQRHSNYPNSTARSASDTVTFQPPQKKRKVEATQGRFGRWTIRSGQWRMRVEQSTNSARGKYEIVFIAVKIDAFTHERARNVRRSFLGSP